MAKSNTYLNTISIPLLFAGTWNEITSPLEQLKKGSNNLISIQLNTKQFYNYTLRLWPMAMF